ncbi:signal peptidase I [Microbacterium sp. NPDC055683]
MSTTAVPATRRQRRGDAADPAAARPRRTVGRVVGDLLLSLAALAGSICIVLVILAAVFDITLIMFRTGSMAPTIPTGSVAVVQRIPASEIDVGEVVTVDRAGELPVTHRVTSVSAGASDDERVITMRGDANEADDVAPYTVSSARLVLFSVPGIAPVIASFGSPFVIGGMTVGAALLVGWAFWPRSDRTTRAADGGDDAG